MNTTQDSSLLAGFPEVKLSYEIFSHKKVSNSDIVIAIPRGPKYYAWFVRRDARCICLLLELNDQNQITRVRETPCCFSSSLATNTLFYGTLYEHKKQPFFTVEDLLYYQGTNFQPKNFLCKLKTVNPPWTMRWNRNAAKEPPFSLEGQVTLRPKHVSTDDLWACHQNNPQINVVIRKGFFFWCPTKKVDTSNRDKTRLINTLSRDIFICVRFLEDFYY